MGQLRIARFKWHDADKDRGKTWDCGPHGTYYRVNRWWYRVRRGHPQVWRETWWVREDLVDKKWKTPLDSLPVPGVILGARHPAD